MNKATLDKRRAIYLDTWKNNMITNLDNGLFCRVPPAGLVVGYQMVAGPRSASLYLALQSVEVASVIKKLKANDCVTAAQMVPWSDHGHLFVGHRQGNLWLEALWPNRMTTKIVRMPQELSTRLRGHTPVKKSGIRAIPWIAGQGYGGTFEIAALENLPAHYLIGGVSGAGKTYAQYSMALQFSAYPDVQMILIDGKGGTSLNCLGHLPGVIAPVVSRYNDVQAALQWAVQEKNRRFELKKQGHKLDSSVVVFIDEFTAYTSDKTVDKAIIKMITDLARQGREAQVHLIMAAHRANLENFGHSDVRTNLNGRLAMQAPDLAASQMILGSGVPERADYLGKAGDAYLKDGNTYHRLQLLYVDETDIANAGTGEHTFPDGFPEYDAEVVGANVAAPPARLRFKPEQVGESILAAKGNKGRGKLQERLEGIGHPIAGGGIAGDLVKLGKAVHTYLTKALYCGTSVTDTEGDCQRPECVTASALLDRIREAAQKKIAEYALAVEVTDILDS